MGANLVTQVLAHWSDLSDRAFRVLIRMAVTALDNPSNGRPAAVYHGGRELLAMSLRSEKGTMRTRYRAVAKAVAELTEAGAIDHLATGWAGQNAVYKLTLDRSGGSRMGGPKDHPKGGSTDHPMDVPSGTEWVVPETTPRNQEEPLKEREEEEMADLRTAVTLALEPRAEPSPTPRPASIVEIFPGASQEARYRPPPRWSTSAMAEVEAATARRAARIAAHQAQIAAEAETRETS
jgi:hypothetical protein